MKIVVASVGLGDSWSALAPQRGSPEALKPQGMVSAGCLVRLNEQVAEQRRHETDFPIIRAHARRLLLH